MAGFKPSYGVVSRYGLVAYASSLDQIGPVGATVADCALVLSAIAGHDARDATSLPLAAADYTSDIDRGVEGLRLGVPGEYFVEGMEDGVRRAVEQGIATLESLGATIEEVSLPSTRYALACYYIIAPSECSANLARYDGVKVRLLRPGRRGHVGCHGADAALRVRAGGHPPHHAGDLRPFRGLLRRPTT